MGLHRSYSDGAGFCRCKIRPVFADDRPLEPGSGGCIRSFQDGLASEALGVILVLAGSAIILDALRNHRVYVSSLPVEDISLLPIPKLASFLSLYVATTGILLAVYLRMNHDAPEAGPECRICSIDR